MTCKAMRQCDQMRCVECRLLWDITDTAPECKAEEMYREQRSSVGYGITKSMQIGLERKAAAEEYEATFDYFSPKPDNVKIAKITEAELIYRHVPGENSGQRKNRIAREKRAQARANGTVFHG